MNHISAVLHGLGIWTFVFAVAMLIFPLHATERPLFESIMPVALVLAVSLASVRYFRKAKKKTLMVGLCLGLIWLGVSVVIDIPMFGWGPMKMTIADYIKDIGTTYLLIPIITTAFGYIYEKNK